GFRATSKGALARRGQLNNEVYVGHRKAVSQQNLRRGRKTGWVGPSAEPVTAALIDRLGKRQVVKRVADEERARGAKAPTRRQLRDARQTEQCRQELRESPEDSSSKKHPTATVRFPTRDARVGRDRAVELAELSLCCAAETAELDALVCRQVSGRTGPASLCLLDGPVGPPPSRSGMPPVVVNSCDRLVHSKL